MKQLAIATLGVAVLAAASGFVHAAEEPPANGTITLKYDARGASRARTPAFMSGYNRFSVGSSSSMGIKVAGKVVKTSAKVIGRRFLLGFDRDGDGKIANSEWGTIPASGKMLISGKSDGKPYLLGLTKMRVRYNRKTVSCWGQAVIRSSMAGKLNGVPVRLLDDNMDGQFSQTPSRFSGDAIMIGSSASAIPLRGTHRIGKHIYKLKVAADGSSIAYQRVDDVKLGKVNATFPASSLRSLVLVGADCAFDVKTDGLTGIPAGSYKLAYGSIGRSSSNLVFKPGRATPQYDIQADMMNILRIGSPIRLDFAADYRGGKVGLAAHNVSVIGSGSEVYGPLDFTEGGNAKPPKVIMLNGRKVASVSTMKYG